MSLAFSASSLSQPLGDESLYGCLSHPLYLVDEDESLCLQLSLSLPLLDDLALDDDEGELLRLLLDLLDLLGDLL